MTAVETLTSDQLEPKVLRAPEPVVLDFYQTSCLPCRVLEPRLERIAEQYAGRVPVYRVDIDQDLTAAERFNVKSLPTVLVLRAGTEVERLDGLITDAALTAAFDRAARGE